MALTSFPPLVRTVSAYHIKAGSTIALVGGGQPIKLPQSTAAAALDQKPPRTQANTVSQIRDELEEKLRAQQVVVGQDNNDEVDVPHIHDIESEEWQREVTRAVDDVGRIAKSRLGVLGLA